MEQAEGGGAASSQGEVAGHDPGDGSVPPRVVRPLRHTSTLGAPFARMDRTQLCREQYISRDAPSRVPKSTGETRGRVDNTKKQPRGSTPMGLPPEQTHPYTPSAAADRLNETPKTCVASDSGWLPAGHTRYLDVAAVSQRQQPPIRDVHVVRGHLVEVRVELLVRAEIPDPSLSFRRREEAEQRGVRKRMDRGHRSLGAKRTIRRLRVPPPDLARDCGGYGVYIETPHPEQTGRNGERGEAS